MFNRFVSFVRKNRARLAVSVPSLSLMLPLTAYASDSGGESAGAGVSTVLGLVGELSTWCLKTFTSLTGWLVADSLGGVYLGMFIFGFAIAALFRLLHSA